MNHLNQLKDKARELGDDVYRVCEGVLEDERFPIWSGSSKNFQHHYGQGGLITHIHEVVNLCSAVAVTYPEHNIDRVELFLAAFFHDVGKMYDYEPVMNLTVHKVDEPTDYTNETDYSIWASAPHKRKIHHISRSGIMWGENARKVPEIYEKYYEEVLHAILAHHTFRAAGSPVAPKTRVAWMVTLCDNLSARICDADTFDVLNR